MQYKPSDAAKACNTSVNTIRNWCRDYASFLSPSARGNEGNRVLTDKDLNTLKYIAQLRTENLQQAAIAQRLQETSIGDVETLTTLQGPAIAATTAYSEEIAPGAVQEGIQQAQGIVVALEAMQRQIDAIQQARQEDRQEYRRPQFDTITILGVGICIGLLFCAILIGLAWLYGGG